jgi:hypothetical protein
MFKKAYAIAANYTWPIVMPRQTVEGKCYCSIGSMVILNQQGWFLTAYHMISAWKKLIEEKIKTDEHEASEKAIKDTMLKKSERKSRLAKLGKLQRDATRNYAGYWGREGLNLVECFYNKVVDLAVGRLEPFDSSWVTQYPIIKNPSIPFTPGVSLCKLGFPFHSIKPSYNESRHTFEMPPFSSPLPLFPIDGILTRMMELVLIPPDIELPLYPVRFIETSSPGLRGQSGGPIFDTNGVVWGIQIRTRPFPLGFEPIVPGKGVKEHQFLNVGIGVHAVTIVGLLKEQGIECQLSTD